MEKYFDEMKRIGWSECDMELLNIHKNIIGQFLDDRIYNSEIENSMGFLLDFSVAVQNIEEER